MAGSDLEQRLTRLEDIEAIKRLKALYCDICDDDHNPDRIVKIFAENGIWEGGDFGKAQGHDAIRKLFESFAKLISFSQHNVFNPRIEVEATAPLESGISWGHLRFARIMVPAGSRPA